MPNLRPIAVLLSCVLVGCVPFFDTEPSGAVEEGPAGGETACCTETDCLALDQNACLANGGTFSAVSCAEADCFPDCAAYCSDWNEICAPTLGDAFGGLAGDCFSFCQEMDWAPGTFRIPHPGNDTLGCRIYHLDNALSDREAHCPHSGPTGANVCGDWCGVYCNMANSLCEDVDFAAVFEGPGGAAIDRVAFEATFSDEDVCATRCRGEGPGEPMPTNGQIGDTSGDSVQCRMYHLITASDGLGLTGRAAHCAHGSLSSFNNVCSGPVPQTGAPTPSP
jgi:hypothetical protein